MADEFTSNTFPFWFTISPASLDPSVPRPGPYLFHGGGMQNPQYPLLSTNALQFMPAISLRSTSSLAASSTSTGESSKNSPTEGSVNRNRCPNWSDAETRFLLEIWRDSFSISRRRNSGAWDTIAKNLNPHCLVLTSSPSEKYGENQYKRSHFFKVARFCNLNLLSKRLKFHSKNRCKFN